MLIFPNARKLRRLMIMSAFCIILVNIVILLPTLQSKLFYSSGGEDDKLSTQQNIQKMVERRVKVNLVDNRVPTEVEQLEDFPVNGPFQLEKNIHQTWMGSKIPKQFEDNIRNFKNMHPDFKYYFWTDDAIRKFVEKKFPAILPFYDNYKINLRRADAMRYMVLYEYGGIYADMDMKIFRPLHPIMRKYSCFMAQEPYTHPIIYGAFYGVACNALMACRKGHPFMKILVENLPAFSVADNILDATGPRYVTMMFRNYLADNPNVDKTDRDGVYLTPPEYFMPSVDKDAETMLRKECNRTNVPDLLANLCKLMKTSGVRRKPLPWSFADHMWAHITFKDPNKLEKIEIRELIPDVIL